jgi:hypothetical protein
MKIHSSCSGDTRVDFITPQTDQDHARARTHFPDCPPMAEAQLKITPDTSRTQFALSILTRLDTRME